MIIESKSGSKSARVEEGLPALLIVALLMVLLTRIAPSAKKGLVNLELPFSLSWF